MIFWKKIFKGVGVGVHKIQNFHDKTKTRLLYSRSRQDQKCQDQDKTRLVQKIQEILNKSLENIDELIFFTEIVHDILKVLSFKYPSSQKIYFTKKFKNCWKNILKNQCNYALLRNCALKLSSLYSNLTDDHVQQCLRTANSTYKL